MEYKPNRMLFALVVISTTLLLIEAIFLFGIQTAPPTILILGTFLVIFGGMIYASIAITKAPKEEKRNHARPGFILLMLFLVAWIISNFELKFEAEKRRKQEQAKWENPAIYHFLQLSEEAKDVTIRVNNGFVFSQIGEDHQTILFKVPDDLIGKEAKINVTFQLANNKMMSYEGKAMLNAPPDTLTLNALINQ